MAHLKKDDTQASFLIIKSWNFIEVSKGKAFSQQITDSREFEVAQWRERERVKEIMHRSEGLIFNHFSTVFARTCAVNR